MLLFAYGTLKERKQLAAVIGPAAHHRVVGSGTVRGVLYDAGEYPVLRPSRSAADVVPGVLIELGDAALPRLDAYEGVHSGLYVRRRCRVRLPDGRRAAAWVYIYSRPTAGLLRIAAWPPGRD